MYTGHSATGLQTRPIGTHRKCEGAAGESSGHMHMHLVLMLPLIVLSINLTDRESSVAVMDLGAVLFGAIGWFLAWNVAPPITGAEHTALRK